MTVILGLAVTDLHAKKKALIVNWAIVHSILVTCRFAISARTKMGRPFVVFWVVITEDVELY